tara:strand:+ start:2417 stop:2614 length:198 start_codon:yes stop_codon:yes gene_type:complete
MLQPDSTVIGLIGALPLEFRECFRMVWKALRTNFIPVTVKNDHLMIDMYFSHSTLEQNKNTQVNV